MSLLPKNIKIINDKIGNIKKDVIVIGMLKKIELWDPRTLDKFDKKNSSLNNHDFDGLADKISF